MQRILLSALLLWTSSLAMAQIGYVNLELVLQLMPESQTMEQELRLYDQAQAETLKPLNDSLQAGLADLRARQDAGETTDALQADAESLEAMRNRLLEAREEAEARLFYRQQLFEQEIYRKLERHIQALAEEQGYPYVFNSQAQGTSVLVHAPDGINLTRELLEHMQVPLDELNQGE